MNPSLVWTIKYVRNDEKKILTEPMVCFSPKVMRFGGKGIGFNESFLKHQNYPYEKTCLINMKDYFDPPPPSLFIYPIQTR
ncbi:hypothetical protein CsSME_00046784 [Camellia sinensis var. sinensis]